MICARIVSLLPFNLVLEISLYLVIGLYLFCGMPLKFRCCCFSDLFILFLVQNWLLVYSLDIPFMFNERKPCGNQVLLTPIIEVVCFNLWRNVGDFSIDFTVQEFVSRRLCLKKAGIVWRMKSIFGTAGFSLKPYFE